VSLGAQQFQGGASGEREPGFNLRRYLTALIRHKWLVVAAVVLGGVGGYLMARFRPPIYEARATVLTLEEAPGPEPINTGRLLSDQAWIDLMKSFSVLDEAVRDLRLYVQYEEPADSLLFADFGLQSRFSPGSYLLAASQDGRSVTLSRDNVVVTRSTPGDSVGSEVGFSWRPDPQHLLPGASAEFAVLPPRDIAARLITSLRVRTDRGGSFLHVALEGTNPVRIAATVNTVLDRFVEVAAELKRRKLTEQVTILQEQLDNAASNLSAAEEALESFRVATITMPSDRATPIAPGIEQTRDPVFTNFFNMQIELAGLQRDREAVERVLADRADADWNPLDLESVGSVRESSDLKLALEELTETRAELRSLQTQFTAEHPQVVRLSSHLQTLQGETVPALARALLNDLEARESDIERRLSSASGELRQIPARSIQEARLARDVEIAELLYTELESRFEELRLAELSSIPDVSILDPAVVPQRPVSDQGQRLLLLGLMGGLGFGMAGAILLDRIDRRVRYPEQVSDQLGLPILGVVPHLRGAKNGERSRDGMPVVEAFRGIRLNLLQAHGTGKVILTVTSPGSGDGKSFVASNLALSLADAGVRTVLVDADTRKGAQHRVLGLRRKPGLTDHLAGKVALGGVVQESSYDSLHFVGGGTRMAGAPELLTGAGMMGLLTELRARYEAIIVDSPPLGAGVDAYALGSVSGNLLLVLRTGKTDREETETKLDMLERFPIRLLGAVLNDVRQGDAYGYRYYQYYMRGYDYEIEPEDETEDVGARTLTQGPGNEG
jgi:capsular exopolysaccharide synthesis family protein